MKYKNILITGGAGFIGSFLTDSLIEKGYSVTILDNLEDQVHKGKKPSYLNNKATFINGDIRDYKIFNKALVGIDVVFHLAARVGVGQSNYLVKEYVDTNIGGMANLLDIVANTKTSVKKIIMTASMTSYGEGNYRCSHCGITKPPLRPVAQLQKHKWELYCQKCKRKVIPIATKENASVNNNSIYALTKNVQEAMLLFVGATYGIPVVSLRCFNVYGPRQSLSNPYTGVTAIFISRLKNGKRPVIYEDGNQTRDFVSVHDLVDALIKAMKSDRANDQIINIGGGKPIPVGDIAVILAKLLKKDIEPQITYEFRKNDIRHCYADIAKAKEILGWRPKISLERGLKELISWSNNEISEDLFENAQEELRSKDLL